MSNISSVSRILVFGAGGHSRSVLAILKSINSCQDITIVDIGEKVQTNESVMGIAVVPFSADFIHDFDPSDVFVYIAIGNNELRSHYWNMIKNLGFSTPNLISPKSIIDPLAKVGVGNLVMPLCYLGPECVVGDNNILNTASVFEHESSVGSHCHIAPSVSIAGRVKIGNYCFLGIGSRILENITIADHSTLGAGAVLVKNITEPNSIYTGVPAKSLVK